MTLTFERSRKMEELPFCKIEKGIGATMVSALSEHAQKFQQLTCLATLREVEKKSC